MSGGGGACSGGGDRSGANGRGFRGQQMQRARDEMDYIDLSDSNVDLLEAPSAVQQWETTVTLLSSPCAFILNWMPRRWLEWEREAH